MFLDSQEKKIVKKLSISNNFEVDELIKIILKDIGVFDERAFEVWRKPGRNNFSMGITYSNETEEGEIFKIDIVVSYITKAIKLIDNLEKEGYLHIAKTGIPRGKPILSIGNKNNTDTELLVIENKEIVQKMVYLISSKIEFTEKFEQFLKNDFQTEAQLNFNKSIELTKRNSINSSIIVIANFLGLLLSLGLFAFSYYTFYESKKATTSTISNLESISEYTKNVQNSLDSVALGLENLPKKLDTFSLAIDNLNRTVNGQQEEFINKTKNLNESVDLMTKSISNYQEYVINYSTQLEEIVKLTDQQLEIWKDQQKIVRDEYSRRPKFEITAVGCDMNDGKMKIKGISIWNNGNIEAKIESLRISFDNSIYKLSKETKTFTEFRNDSELSIYYFKANQFGKETNVIPDYGVNMDFPLEEIGKGNISIYILLAYSSRYDANRISKTIKLINCKEN